MTTPLLTLSSAARRVWLTAAVTAVLGANTACDIGTPSADFDPLPTLRTLDDVRAPIDPDDDFLLGLDLAVATLDYYGGGQLARAVYIRPERGEGLLSSLRRERITGAVGSGGSGTQTGATPEPFTIPWDMVGETLEWDPVHGYVLSGRTGAPTYGVRFLLYRMDWQTGYPLSPLSQVGYLDLTDRDGSGAEAVGVRGVATDGPDRVIADYQVTLTGSGTYDEGQMQLATRGAIGDTRVVELDLTQRLSWSRSQNQDQLRLIYSYRRGTRSVGLTGVAESRFDGLEWDTFDFAVSVRDAGVSTGIDALVGRDGYLTGEISSDGRSVVRVGGYDGRPEFEWTDRRGMTQTERSTLEQIWDGITDLIRRTEWVVIPADLLVASG